MKDYQYYGLFLDIDTKNMLMDTLTDNIDYNIALGVADRIFIDHCTLLHKSQLDSNENLQSYLESNLGKSISIKLVAVGISDKAMAFKVEGVDNICANEVPHITIATFRGGNPVGSNKITNWRYIEPTIEQTHILATNETDIIEVFHLHEGRKYNLDGYLMDWSRIVAYFNLTKWAYVADILPKGGEE